MTAASSTGQSKYRKVLCELQPCPQNPSWLSCWTLDRFPDSWNTLGDQRFPQANLKFDSSPLARQSSIRATKTIFQLREHVLPKLPIQVSSQWISLFPSQQKVFVSMMTHRFWHTSRYACGAWQGLKSHRVPSKLCRLARWHLATRVDLQTRSLISNLQVSIFAKSEPKRTAWTELGHPCSRKLVWQASIDRLWHGLRSNSGRKGMGSCSRLARHFTGS